MYLAIDDLGDENVATISACQTEHDKWQHIAACATAFEMAGIQIGPHYRTEYGISLLAIPEVIRRSFRLTYHLGGIYHLVTSEDEQLAHTQLADSLVIARDNGMEDVSVHPPVVANMAVTPPYVRHHAPTLQRQSQERLATLLHTWRPRFADHGITLSLETHVTESVFVFSGLPEFARFIAELPGVGVLIDLCHNYYDGYEVPDVLTWLQACTITGIHLSDAVRRNDLASGTHLPLGQGEIDVSPVLDRFSGDDSVYGAFEVRGSAEGIAQSVVIVRNGNSSPNHTGQCGTEGEKA
jgi:sugar phosphate isomerase/epimerase